MHNLQKTNDPITFCVNNSCNANAYYTSISGEVGLNDTHSNSVSLVLNASLLSRNYANFKMCKFSPSILLPLRKFLPHIFLYSFPRKSNVARN